MFENKPYPYRPEVCPEKKIDNTFSLQKIMELNDKQVILKSILLLNFNIVFVDVVGVDLSDDLQG